MTLARLLSLVGLEMTVVEWAERLAAVYCPCDLQNVDRIQIRKERFEIGQPAIEGSARKQRFADPAGTKHIQPIGKGREFASIEQIAEFGAGLPTARRDTSSLMTSASARPCRWPRRRWCCRFSMTSRC
jgi:hypothetical protein